MNIQQNPNVNNQNNAADSPSVLNAKWGRDMMALGYTVVPDILLIHMGRMGMAPAELVVILQLLRFWWSPDQLPYPSKGKLAEAIGCSEKNVQKLIARLERQGYLRRIERRHPGDRSGSNLFDLKPLIEKFAPLVVEEAGKRREKAAARQDLMASVRRGIESAGQAPNPLPASGKISDSYAVLARNGSSGYRPAVRPGGPDAYGSVGERI